MIYITSFYNIILDHDYIIFLFLIVRLLKIHYFWFNCLVLSAVYWLICNSGGTFYHGGLMDAVQWALAG